MCLFFFFNDTATTEIYTLSLHDALPICGWELRSSSPSHGDPRRPHGRREHGCGASRFDSGGSQASDRRRRHPRDGGRRPDRKSTRLNSSHLVISYAVFCLKKKTCFLQSV